MLLSLNINNFFMNENYGTNNIGTIVVELKANMDDRQIIIKYLHLF